MLLDQSIYFINNITYSYVPHAHTRTCMHTHAHAHTHTHTYTHTHIHTHTNGTHIKMYFTGF